MHVGTEMTTPALTDSPSYPYSADVVLKIDKKDGKPYDKDVRLKLRFSAKDESWELAEKEPQSYAEKESAHEDELNNNPQQRKEFSGNEKNLYHCRCGSAGRRKCFCRRQQFR